MSDAPEEIWVKPNHDYTSIWGRPLFTDPFDEHGTEYTRSDIAAARIEALAAENARLRGALERCLNFIANTESEMGETLESGDIARAALKGSPE